MTFFAAFLKEEKRVGGFLRRGAMGVKVWDRAITESPEH